jgi:hypothetical protein
MTSAQHLSRQADWKVLIPLGSLLFAALVGYVLPPPTEYPPDPKGFPPLTVLFGMRFVDAFIAVSLLVLVWGVFRLLEPGRRYSRTWVIAKTVGIPLIWITLIVALGYWFAYLHTEWFQQKYGPPMVL